MPPPSKYGTPNAAPATTTVAKFPRLGKSRNTKKQIAEEPSASTETAKVSFAKNVAAPTARPAARAVRKRRKTCETNVTTAAQTKEYVGITSALPTIFAKAMIPLIFKSRFCSPAATSK